MSQKYSVSQTTNFVSKALTPDNKAFLPAALFPHLFEVGRRHWEATRLPVDSPPLLLPSV